MMSGQTFNRAFPVHRVPLSLPRAALDSALDSLVYLGFGNFAHHSSDGPLR